MIQYLAVVEQGHKNWSAYVPDLPGCVAAAQTRAETEELIREAIALHIEAMRQDREFVPEPSSFPLGVSVA